VRDGVHRRTGGEPVYQEARAPTGEALQGLLEKIMVGPLQAASCTYPIALWPRPSLKG